MASLEPHLPLAALRSFEAAARLGSFTAAAAQLGLKPSAVSHQVRGLEQRFGQPLFTRGRRGVTLTAAGHDYALAVTDAFDALRTATRHLTADPTLIRLSAMPGFARQWLLPALPAFRRLHPKLTLRVDVTHAQVDIARAAADLGIRYGGGRWPALHATLLLRVAAGPVAAPSLAFGTDWSADATLLAMTAAADA